MQLNFSRQIIGIFYLMVYDFKFNFSFSVDSVPSFSGESYFSLPMCKVRLAKRRIKYKLFAIQIIALKAEVEIMNCF
jgi:hypothetical protein